MVRVCNKQIIIVILGTGNLGLMEKRAIEWVWVRIAIQN
jgi:hypothetical protein